MYVFGFLVFILVVVGLFLSVSNWLERLVSEMTYYVSSGTLNSTNSTQLFLPSPLWLGHDVRSMSYEVVGKMVVRWGRRGLTSLTSGLTSFRLIIALTVVYRTLLQSSHIEEIYIQFISWCRVHYCCACAARQLISVKVKVKRTCIAPYVKLQLKALRYGSHMVALANYTIPASTLRMFARWRHLNGKHLIQHSFIDHERLS